MANLAAALAPLLTSGRAISQQQQSTSPTGNLLADLMAPSPARTQAQQMRTTIGGMFGLDTRPPIEKLQEKLAGMPLSTAADYTNAAKAAKDLGLSAQAVQLNALATQKKKDEEELRVKTQATVAGRAASAQRIATAMQNTSDPRVQRELQSLLPSAGTGELAGAELSTAINQAFSRHEIKPMTTSQRASYDNLITEDPELMKLIEEPSFLSKVFGGKATPETGREAIISELHILQQQNPNVPLGQLADVFLESIGPQLLQVEGVGDLSELPSEEASQLEPYDPSMEPVAVEDQNEFLEKRQREIQQMQEEVNAELDRLGYGEASPKVRNQQYQRLMSSRMRAKGMYKSPPAPLFQL